MDYTARHCLKTNYQDQNKPEFQKEPSLQGRVELSGRAHAQHTQDPGFDLPYQNKTKAPKPSLCNYKVKPYEITNLSLFYYIQPHPPPAISYNLSNRKEAGNISYHSLNKL